ncbi:septal ring lytic transglycosylase RlpA family protein [Hydrogenophaga taeniospiralis]|uniref:septal ring lytic transglycosylase RlpA family protein n=1 Tax=Hydrogenophaga taeniospiralis TaxID=65656 RepID=UPI001CFC21B5|nr:septal ring lytic transglycosylase RlpA family protein [Hydrogenophaga taeniospiralis]MCB4362163.1 septal ring lytic transglycosylase RlpA family protein [Hydrogenophaga taeniospiralis]
MPSAPNPTAGRPRLAIALLATLVAACAGPSPVSEQAPDEPRPGPAVRSHASPADEPAAAPTPAPASASEAPGPANVEAPAAHAAPATPSASDELIDQGLASWYGKRFHGRRTASGERYDMHAFTAAHKTLPFGTRVRVRSVRTGQEVVVRINDRGPFRRGRVIDLSQAAINALGLRQRGVTAVELLRE